jgi:hypothetical protein
MTIHWKALEEHFLMVPLSNFLIQPFPGEVHFLDFSQKTSVLEFMSFNSNYRSISIGLKTTKVLGIKYWTS